MAWYTLKAPPLSIIEKILSEETLKGQYHPWKVNPWMSTASVIFIVVYSIFTLSTTTKGNVDKEKPKFFLGKVVHACSPDGSNSWQSYSVAQTLQGFPFKGKLRFLSIKYD